MDSTLSLPKMLLPLPPSRTAAGSTHLRLPLLRPSPHRYRCFAGCDRGALPGAAFFSSSSSFARSLLRCSPAAPPSSRFASLSSAPALSISGGGGDGLAGVVGGGGGGGGDGGSSGSEAAAKSLAGETEDLAAPGSDVIVLHVGGMSCGGCAASVRRILESQPQVASATVSFEKSTAFIWVVPEVKAEQDWKQQLGEKLAKHLTTCGFQSDLQGRQLLDELHIVIEEIMLLKVKTNSRRCKLQKLQSACNACQQKKVSWHQLLVQLHSISSYQSSITMKVLTSSIIVYTDIFPQKMFVFYLHGAPFYTIIITLYRQSQNKTHVGLSLELV